MVAPDIVVRPESGKLSAFGRPPGSIDDEGMHEVFFLRDAVDTGRARAAARSGVSRSSGSASPAPGRWAPGSPRSPASAASRPISTTPMPEALDAGERRLRAALAKGAERGRWSESEAEAGAARLRASRAARGPAPLRARDRGGARGPRAEARAVRPAGRDLRRRRGPGDQHLVAAGDRDRRRVPRPERVVGMHFFNPPALMRLVEVVAGERELRGRARALPQRSRGAMGREPVRAADGPGFIANRVARPFGLEALRLLGERDRRPSSGSTASCGVGGGFRMGPFELMDLVGDRRRLRGLEVVLRAELPRAAVAAAPDPGADGPGGPPRAQGRPRLLRLRPRPHRPADPERPAPAEGAGAPADGAIVERADFRAVSVATGSLATLDAGRGSVGYYALPPIAAAPLVELTRGRRRTTRRRWRAERLLPRPRKARRVGRRLARPRARPDRVPDRQRGRVRARRRGRHRRRTSTPRCGSASTTRGGRSSGRTAIGLEHVLVRARRAVDGAARGALSRGAAAAATRSRPASPRHYPPRTPRADDRGDRTK